MSLFDTHLTVLRQPLRAAGRSSAAAERLLALVSDLPDGSALALVEERPSRDIAKPPALLKRARRRGDGARRSRHRASHPDAASSEAGSRHTRHALPIETRAAHVLRIGSAAGIWETDVERGEMTRVADSELRKLATYAGERPITPTTSRL